MNQITSVSFATSTLRRLGRSLLLLPALVLALAGRAHAQTNGTWSDSTSGGLWSNTANWSLGTVANGTGATADFSQLNLTANNTVTLDSVRTESRPP